MLRRKARNRREQRRRTAICEMPERSSALNPSRRRITCSVSIAARWPVAVRLRAGAAAMLQSCTSSQCQWIDVLHSVWFVRAGLSQSRKPWPWASAEAASPQKYPSLKMILEMPRSFTDHPLSRKVELLKLHVKILYIFKKILKLCYWQVQALSEDGSLRDSKVQLM